MFVGLPLVASQLPDYRQTRGIGLIHVHRIHVAYRVSALSLPVPPSLPHPSLSLSPTSPGGTGDMAAVFEELCQRYPATRFIGIGFSLGACVLVRFLGEDEGRQKKFICAASVCQGYDPTL